MYQGMRSSGFAKFKVKSTAQDEGLRGQDQSKSKLWTTLFASARLERKAVKLSRKPSNDTAADEARIKAWPPEFIATAVARDRHGHDCCGLLARCGSHAVTGSRVASPRSCRASLLRQA